MLARILEIVEALVAKWQAALGDDVQVILGGSLVSGLFILDSETTAIDVDVRFLVENPEDEEIRQRIESVTGLKYRKTIPVADWPEGSSVGVMIEGFIKIPELDLPLEVEGCIRNTHYVGWARFYQQVLTLDELAEIRRRKIKLRHDKRAYKVFKQEVLAIVQRRVLDRRLLKEGDHVKW